MGEKHGETIMQKPIAEYAKFIKGLLPASIPETYTLKPLFKSFAREKDIRSGIIAFRDFMYQFCDRLILEGHLYVKPQKSRNIADYPFLHNVNNLLVDIGYHGKMIEKGESLLITDIPSFSASKSKIPPLKILECLRFLTFCGFDFKGIDLNAKKLDFSEVKLMEVRYPKEPLLLIGLKALSVADIELRKRRYSNDDNLLRCDYRMIKAEDTDLLDVLKDYIRPLPKKLQNFAIELHQRQIDVGMTCVTIIDDQHHFSYSYIKNNRRALSSREIYQQRIWELAVSMKFGYILAVRAKKTDKYAEVINKFNLPLQEKIKKGYGCDRKRNEPCQGGCQGIRIPFDDSILEIKKDIKEWLDNEVSFTLGK